MDLNTNINDMNIDMIYINEYTCTKIRSAADSRAAQVPIRQQLVDSVVAAVGEKGVPCLSVKWAVSMQHQLLVGLYRGYIYIYYPVI